MLEEDQFYKFDEKERQIIYRALILYQQFAEEMSNSNKCSNAANEIFHVVSDRTIALMRRLYETWPDVMR